MKKACLICGEEFDCRNQAKICPVCRASGKRICGHCGKVFVTKSKTRYVCKECDCLRAEKARRGTNTVLHKNPPVVKKCVQRQCIVCERVFDTVGQEKTCPTCREYAQMKKEEHEKTQHHPHNPQRLADLAKAAREAGLSYGKYSAMRRGLLRI